MHKESNVAVPHRILIAVAVVAACGPSDRATEAPPETVPAAEERAEAAPLWRADTPVPEIDDRARWDTMWRSAPTVDSAFSMPPAGSSIGTEPDDSLVPAPAVDSGVSIEPVRAADSAAFRRPDVPDSLFTIPESWDDIGTDSVWQGEQTIHVPLGGRVTGPSVLRAQTLLDRANFSPGVLDGRWGGNVERAVFWFQRSQGLRPTGWLDEVTLRRLEQVAGGGALIGMVALSADDVEGPFVDMPADVRRKADLDCMCPASRIEKIAERVHSTPDVLRALNPDTDWDAIAAGDRIRAPLVDRGDDTPIPTAAQDPGVRCDPASADSATESATTADVARIVISDRGRYLHAFGHDGRLLFHFPATLGSDYNPSPTGHLEVTSVTLDPWFHYQPELLEGADPDDPSVRLAPGINSPVGTVWIALSKEHYGIHGTSAPETIGYATSSGCIRLTNWDAQLLARHVGPGTAVEFRDTGK